MPLSLCPLLAAYKGGDYATALREFRPLASQGHAEAQINLGNMYLMGEGVPENDVAAVGWFRKAAEQDFPHGQTALGHMYRVGVGVPQDYAKAAKWYRKAAEQGYPPAQYFFGILYGEGQGVPQDYVQALMWINLAEASLPDKARGPVEMFSVYFAAKMTPSQIAEAEKLAREWRAKHPKKK